MADQVSGVQDTGTLNQSEKVRAVLSKPFEKQKETDSLYVALMKLKGQGKSYLAKYGAKNKKIEWQLDRPFSATVKVGSTAPTTGTSIVAADAEMIEVGAILEYDEEIIKVTAVSGLTLTVLRDVGQYSGAPMGVRNIPAGAYINIQTSRTVAENSVNGGAFALNPDFLYNYSETMRTATAMSWDVINDQTTYKDESQVAFQIRKIRRALKEQIERTILTRTSGPIEIAANGTGNPSTTNPIGNMAGLPYYIQSQYWDADGNPDWRTFNSFMARLATEAGSENFLIIGSVNACQRLDEFGFQNVREQGYDNKQFGRELSMLFGRGWEAKIIPSQQMGKMGGNTWHKTLWVLNMENVGFHEVRPIQLLEADTNVPGTDGKRIDLITQGCIIVGNEAACGRIDNFTA